MASAFAQFLPSFAAPIVAGSEAPFPVKPLGRADTEKRLAERIAEAEAKGRREAADAVRIEMETAHAQDRAAFEAQLAEIRQQVLDANAQALLTKLDEAVAQLETSIATQAARVLGMFLDRALQQRALDELSEIVAAIALDGASARIRISGPGPLIEALKRLQKLPASVDLTVDARADVIVTIGETIIETQLAAWANRLTMALGESNE